MNNYNHLYSKTKRFKEVYPNYQSFISEIEYGLNMPYNTLEPEQIILIQEKIFKRMYAHYATDYFRYNTNGVINEKIIEVVNKLLFPFIFLEDLKNKDLDQLNVSSIKTTSYETDNTTNENLNGYETDATITSTNDYNLIVSLRNEQAKFNNQIEMQLREMKSLFLSYNVSPIGKERLW